MKYYLVKAKYPFPLGLGGAGFLLDQLPTLLLKGDGEKKIIELFETDTYPNELWSIYGPNFLAIRSRWPPKHKDIENDYIVSSINFNNASLKFRKSCFKYNHSTIWHMLVLKEYTPSPILDPLSKTITITMPLENIETLEFDSDDDAKLWFELTIK